MPRNSKYRLSKMEVWMSSLPGRRPGSNWFQQNRKAPTMNPQVTLHMDMHPPVLDTSRPKPPLPNKDMAQGASMRKPNQWWNSLRNMYQSFCAGSTPVTWVNPDMMNELPSVTYSQPYIPESQFLTMEPDGNGNTGGCLWYAAAPEGSQLQFMDPLHVWQQKFVFPVAHPQPCFPNFPNKKSKPSQPLNPEAKEWIPKEMRGKNELSPSSQGCFSSAEDSCGRSPSIKTSLDSTVCQDFCEITENEIAAIRNNDGSVKACSVSSAFPKQQDDQINFTEKSRCDKPVIKTDESNTTKSSSVENKNTGNTPVSYAVVAKKVLSSPEPPRAKSPNEKTKSAGVDQPLPKIFLKDKKYPKEKAAPLMEKSVHTLPFKTANKVQKKNSRKFLNELKALAHAESSDCGSLASESSFGSPCSDGFPQRICHGNILAPCGSQSWEKLKDICAPESRSPRTQRSNSECSSSNSRIRSTSESSVASVDSINIEFEDEVDKNNSLNNVCIISENCQPKCIDNTKLSNSVLAHILGLNDCKSEESDEEWDDSDSDWDEVQNDSTGLDDSWETFGLGLTIPVASFSLNSEKKDTDQGSSLNAEKNCDILDEEEDAFTCNLADVNRRWNEEIEKDISTKTEKRVNFGAVKVHPMVTWAHAYQQARRGPWEQYARDAARFSRHIADLEPVISHVLQEGHRQEVYRKLYGDSSS
ncbi:uncharacterized protein LOC125030915 [Penaeus chinensis]|uniref:uncharacterized protein LOC125030915 n=1 Tax=Penaeus chinensis TaxID=139456 RepID=UPI001FB71F31|nr:uncharacterized protein LOC125030915 [Penaeus chinensis]